VARGTGQTLTLAGGWAEGAEACFWEIKGAFFAGVCLLNNIASFTDGTFDFGRTLGAPAAAASTERAHALSGNWAEGAEASAEAFFLEVETKSETSFSICSRS